MNSSRRSFIGQASRAVAGTWAAGGLNAAFAQIPGDRPAGNASGVTVINPKARVPMSLIIDDSTCLVNMAYFAMPQFAEVFPDRYKQNWRSYPREIPDSFVRKFMEWCHDHGVKGKYSIVPYPSCVGWVDREIPGWSGRELRESLDLVRTTVTPDWDIHPEMISHTWVIDTKTGRPYPERSENFMENWGWSVGKSADELADYMSYALRILKNAGLPCEGITTPGGFCSQTLPELSQATLESCRDVYGTEIPHYFRHSFTDETSVAPRVEYASGLDSGDPRCVVSIIACTGDWFGGWDGETKGSVDKLIGADLQSGRLPEVIDRVEPAIILCHWPGVYFNGAETGFDIFKETVRRVHSRNDNLIWMKLCEIARYWAARELTKIRKEGDRIVFHAPFGTPWFTVRIEGMKNAPPKIITGRDTTVLRQVNGPLLLDSGCWTRDGDSMVVCFDLPKGETSMTTG